MGVILTSRVSCPVQTFGWYVGLRVYHFQTLPSFIIIAINFHEIKFSRFFVCLIVCLGRFVCLFVFVFCIDFNFNFCFVLFCFWFWILYNLSLPVDAIAFIANKEIL